MENSKTRELNNRRDFIGTIATGAAVLGVSSLPQFLNAESRTEMKKDITGLQTPDEWFNQINGRHRIVFDVTHPDEIMPFVGPRIFLATNAATGTPAKDCSIVVVLRHKAIPFAFDSNVWEKYKFGDKFKFDDPASHVASVRNPFWKPAKGDFVIPGIGDAAIGINQLQADGVMFCVCDSAINLQSYIAAASMKMDAGEIKKEWMTALLPGIMVVPSGLWAVDRAQEHKCSYCFVG